MTTRFLLIKRKLYKDIESSRSLRVERRKAPARRPMMGLTNYPDQCGVLTVITKDGQYLDILDLNAIDGRRKTKRYTNFSITSMQRTSMEKAQIVETWGEEFLLVYGKKPEIWNISGVLLSSLNFPWEAEFWFNYENKFRGTKLAEHGARLFFEIRNKFFSGYMMGATAANDAQAEQKVDFQFQLFVTSSGYVDTSSLPELNGSLSPDSTSSMVNSQLTTYAREGEYLDEKSLFMEQAQLSAITGDWRSGTQNFVNGELDGWMDDPHLASEAFGASNLEVPDTYGNKLTQGFRSSNKTSVTGEGISEFRNTIKDLNKAAGVTKNLLRTSMNTATTIGNTYQKFDTMVKNSNFEKAKYNEARNRSGFLTNSLQKYSQNTKKKGSNNMPLSGIFPIRNTK